MAFFYYVKQLDINFFKHATDPVTVSASWNVCYYAMTPKHD